MYFETWQKALDMAGHGVFVWPCFIVTFVVLLALVVHPLWLTHKTRSEVAGKIRRRDMQQEAS